MAGHQRHSQRGWGVVVAGSIPWIFGKKELEGQYGFFSKKKSPKAS
jgi:uncharacterized membrane protein